MKLLDIYQKRYAKKFDDAHDHVQFVADIALKHVTNVGLDGSSLAIASQTNDEGNDRDRDRDRDEGTNNEPTRPK